MDCLFCKLIAGELPSYKVYEDENVFAFLDINPVNPGHTLVIPKKHFSTMEDITVEELAEVMKVVKTVGRAIKQGLELDGYNVNINNGEVAGQIVPHLHFHVIPRKEGDGLDLWPQGKYGDGEAEDTVKKIKGKI